MWQDLLTAFALVLILEGILPGLAPRTWLKAMQDASKLGPNGIRIAGIALMLTGVILLQFIR